MSNVDIMKEFLLKPVMFTSAEKTVRKGRLLLFHQTDYYIRFTIQTNKNITKNYEVPYPYKIKQRNNHEIVFSYLISDLCRKNEGKIDFVADITDKSIANKIYDRQLTISVIDD